MLKREEHVDFLSLKLSVFLLALSVFWVSVPHCHPITGVAEEKEGKTQLIPACASVMLFRGHSRTWTLFHLLEDCVVTCIFSTTVVCTKIKSNNLQILTKFINTQIII